MVLLVWAGLVVAGWPSMTLYVSVSAGITGPFPVGLSKRPAWAFSHGSGVPSGSEQQRAGPVRLDLELVRHHSHPSCGEEQVKVR